MAATSTPLNNFPQAVSNLLINEVLNVIVENAAKENIPLSLDKLMGWLSIPQTAKTASAMGGSLQVPNIPGFLAGGSVAASAPASTRKKGPVNGPTCQYIFVRGAKKNQPCGEPAMEGSQFCRTCAKKKSAGGPGTGSSSGAAAAGGDFRGVASSAVAPSPQADDSTSVTVTALRDRPGFYKTVKHGIIIQQQAAGNVVATAIEDKDTGTIRPLTPEEKALANSLGFSTINDDGTETPGNNSGAAPAAAPPTSIPTVTPAAVIPTVTPTLPKPPMIGVPRT